MEVWGKIRRCDHPPWEEFSSIFVELEHWVLLLHCSLRQKKKYIERLYSDTRSEANGHCLDNSFVKKLWDNCVSFPFSSSTWKYWHIKEKKTPTTQHLFPVMCNIKGPRKLGTSRTLPRSSLFYTDLQTCPNPSLNLSLIN